MGKATSRIMLASFTLQSYCQILPVCTDMLKLLSYQAKLFHKFLGCRLLSKLDRLDNSVLVAFHQVMRSIHLDC
jgi:hypothetical protein